MKIFDSGPLIAILGDISSPELIEELISLGYKIYAPLMVISEITYDPGKTNLNTLLQAGKVEKLELVDNVSISNFRNRYPNLGLGESELILSAQLWYSEQKIFCCIIDDRVARRTAESFGLKCKGTIGILQKLNKEKKISDNKLHECYKKLEDSGFRYDFKCLNDSDVQ